MSPAWTIFKKELKETLRDRRTLLIMIGMPLLLIPLILSLATKVATSQADAEREKDVRIGLVDHENGADLIYRLERRKDVIINKTIAAKDFKTLIREDSLDLGIVIAPDFDQQVSEGKTGGIEIFYNSTNDIPYDRIYSTIEAYHLEVRNDRLALLGAAPELVEPTLVTQTDVYTQRENFGKMVGGFLPYIFVIFCLLGSMYPSIDLFTGEKERGTLETILTIPASRLQILMGKMATIVLAGVLSGGLAILGLYLAIKFNPEVPSVIQNIILQILNPTAISQILLLIIPLTIFFAGVLIPTSIYARSFKEAQTMIQPMVIVVIIPLAIVATLPNLPLNSVTALIPIVNVGLASREIIAGTVDIGLFLIVFGSLVFLAAIGIAVCIRWFGQEGNILRS
ncbi:MAG: ABC transporter permease [Saprospiraceae bacterium]|nr:ABC transporter permease [Saprospiraceae bacterium]